MLTRLFNLVPLHYHAAHVHVLMMHLHTMSKLRDAALQTTAAKVEGKDRDKDKKQRPRSPASSIISPVILTFSSLSFLVGMN